MSPSLIPIPLHNQVILLIQLQPTYPSLLSLPLLHLLLQSLYQTPAIDLIIQHHTQIPQVILYNQIQNHLDGMIRLITGTRILDLMMNIIVINIMNSIQPEIFLLERDIPIEIVSPHLLHPPLQEIIFVKITIIIRTQIPDQLTMVVAAIVIINENKL